MATTTSSVKLESCEHVTVPSHAPIPVGETKSVTTPSTTVKQEDMGLGTAPVPAPLPTIPTHANAANVAAARAAALAVPATTRTVPPLPSQVGSAPKALCPQTNKTKKSKSKQVATVTMATAATATPSGATSQGENTGRWTAEEHRLFLSGLEQFGKGWKKIASLIKSRTVVQIRTHAQKYFQKLAKARQNGEDGDIAMDARGVANPNTNAVMGLGPGGNSGQASNGGKRRRPNTGTKRKAISSVVASAQREGKRLATVSASSRGPIPPPPLPAVAPALSPYVVQVPMKHQAAPGPSPMQQTSTSTVPSITTAHGTISGAALEDSLFRFLTPATGESVSQVPYQVPMPSSQVNEVARQAGANPIMLPTDNSKQQHHEFGGESPTGVAEIENFPPWAFGNPKNEPPTWFSKGSDVDELLNEADALDWLADSGDLTESYQPPPVANTQKASEPSLLSISEPDDTHSNQLTNVPAPIPTPVPSVPNLPSTDHVNSMQEVKPSSSMDTVNMPPLPSLFESNSSMNSALNASKKQKSMNLSAASLFGSATEAADATDNFGVFDAHFDEQAFVTALLENNAESVSNLSALQ